MSLVEGPLESVPWEPSPRPEFSHVLPQLRRLAWEWKLSESEKKQTCGYQSGEGKIRGMGLTD